ncbi:AI-2E family transporter [Candidatus Sumerlaeota bacterium]|nr:AI-2E family transporter [Candidatus Sumerlaeota bacterium]
MNGDTLDRQLKKALTWLCYLIILAGSVYALYTLRSILKTLSNIASPFLVGFIVAYLFDPIVTFLQRRLRLSRIFGLVVVYVIIFLLIGLFLLWLLPNVYHQLMAMINLLVEVLPQKISLLFEKLKIQFTPEQKEKLVEQFKAIQDNLQQIIQAALPGLKAVATGGATAAGTLAKSLVNMLGSIVSFFSFLSFVAVISFYLIVDFSKIRPSIEPLISPRHRQRVFDLLEKVDIAVGGFIRGQLIDCVLVGILTTILLLIAGFKEYALLIGFLAGAGNIVPYLGPIIGATPAVIWVLLSSTYATLSDKLYGVLIVAGIFIFVQSVEGFVFQPRIVGKNSQLHPLLVLLALMVGAHLGIGGLIIAIPTAAALRVLVNELWWQPLCKRNNPPKPEPPPTDKPTPTDKTD